MASIIVPKTFVEDFRFFCERTEMSRLEQQQLREAVRADFEGIGAHIAETAAVYRFCDATWGRVPTVELMRGYLAGLHWWPDDESIFERFGPLLLALLCAQVAGVIPRRVLPSDRNQ